jgi:hypothetical protein
VLAPGPLFCRSEHIVGNIECGSRAVMLSHHASDVQFVARGVHDAPMAA